MALSWPKQLSNNTQTRVTTTTQFHNENDGNYAQSKTGETQPTYWESTVAQNEFENHSPHNMGEINSSSKAIEPREDSHRPCWKQIYILPAWAWVIINAEPTIRPMGKGFSHSIHQSAEEYDMGKNQEIPVRKNEKREGNSLRENAQQSGKHELQVPERLATREEEENMSA